MKVRFSVAKKCYAGFCDLQRAEPVTVGRFNFGKDCFILSFRTLTDQGDRVKEAKVDGTWLETSRIAEEEDIVTCSSPKPNRHLLDVQSCGASVNCFHHIRLLNHSSSNRRGKECRSLRLELFLVVQNYWHWDDLRRSRGQVRFSPAHSLHHQCRASSRVSHFRNRCIRISAHTLGESQCVPRSCPHTCMLSTDRW